MNYHANLPGSAKAGLIITLTILIVLGLVIFSSLRLSAFPL